MNLRRQGAQGERVAEMYLIEHGAELVLRNYRVSRGEIDLIVRMDGATVFVEVKQRTTDKKGSPRAAVDYNKQRRISMAALCYLKEFKLMDTKCRFDVVEVTGDGVNHIKNAFTFIRG